MKLFFLAGCLEISCRRIMKQIFNVSGLAKPEYGIRFLNVLVQLLSHYWIEPNLFIFTMTKNLVQPNCLETRQRLGPLALALFSSSKIARIRALTSPGCVLFANIDMAPDSAAAFVMLLLLRILLLGLPRFRSAIFASDSSCFRIISNRTEANCHAGGRNRTVPDYLGFQPSKDERLARKPPAAFVPLPTPLRFFHEKSRLGLDLDLPGLIACHIRPNREQVELSLPKLHGASKRLLMAPGPFRRR